MFYAINNAAISKFRFIEPSVFHALVSTNVLIQCAKDLLRLAKITAQKLFTFIVAHQNPAVMKNAWFHMAALVISVSSVGRNVFFN